MPKKTLINLKLRSKTPKDCNMVMEGLRDAIIEIIKKSLVDEEDNSVVKIRIERIESNNRGAPEKNNKITSKIPTNREIKDTATI